MKKEFSQDTYFYNVLDAIKEAQNSNDFNLGHPTIFGKQICYYNADEKVEGLPDNCIFVPLEDFYNYFSNTRYRLPQKVVVYKDDLPESEILSESIVNILKIIETERKNLVDVYLKEIKNLEPNFNDEKLRILLPTNRVTTVMQYISKGIFETLKEYKNYEIKLSIQKSEYEDIDDVLPLFVDIHNFNPHIVISINHIFQFLNDRVFNFVWFQDEMPFLKDKTVYNKREREYIFSLTKFHDKLLQDKGIPYQRQNFAINDKIFKINNNIQREEKIVFIGSAYINSIDFSSVPNELIDKLVNNYENGEEFSSSYIEHISDEYNISKEILEGKVIPYIVRDFAVRWLCSSELSKKIKIEIYGWGWDKYPETKQYFNGELKYGQELVDVYSSAKYTLAPHSIYIIQQRVLEAIFCGCQPILYDCRSVDEAPYYEDTLIYYKSKNEMLNSFVQTKEQNFEEFKKEFTYKNFVDKILKIVELEK